MITLNPKENGARSMKKFRTIGLLIVVLTFSPRSLQIGLFSLLGDRFLKINLHLREVGSFWRVWSLPMKWLMKSTPLVLRVRFSK